MMDKVERAYRAFYGLDEDDEIDEDELMIFDPENPPVDPDTFFDYY